MTDKIKKMMEYISLPWKLIIAIGVIVSLFVGLQQVDSRFAKSDELATLESNLKTITAEKFKVAEAETIKTFETFQMQQMIMTKSLQYQILNIQKNMLDRRYYDLKRKLSKNPDDLEIKEEYEDVKQQRKDIQKRINETLKHDGD